MPSLQEQTALVTNIENLEQKIIQAQEKLEKSPKKKQPILDNYLK